ncbi:MAG TPA: GNVR domain-containing protein, partial [Bacillota bacterium]|nr:GNVR domain-containing protein [Bacillota bacterium]
WIAVIGVIYTYVIVTPTYTAETSLIVDVDVETSGTSEQSGIVVAQNLIQTYKVFLVSNLVLESVVEDVEGLPDGYSLNALRNNISVSTTTSVLIINISVENASPALAQEIANTLVTNSIAIADDEENGFKLLQSKLKMLDVAELPTSPSSPNKMLNIVISVLLGGIVALGLVFVKELFNNKFQSATEMEKYLGIKVIAAVPGTMKERKQVE